MQTGRRRIKRKVHVGSETDAILERGKEIGKEIGRKETQVYITAAQTEFDKERVHAADFFEQQRKALQQDIEKKERQIKVMEQRLIRAQELYENRSQVVTHNLEPKESILAMEREKLDRFSDDNRGTSGILKEQTGTHEVQVLRISTDVEIFMSNEVAQFLGGRLEVFAKSVQDLYENVLHTGRVATIVSDPIVYREKIGIFVKGGNARDAALAANGTLRDRDQVVSRGNRINDYTLVNKYKRSQ